MNKVITLFTKYSKTYAMLTSVIIPFLISVMIIKHINSLILSFIIAGLVVIPYGFVLERFNKKYNLKSIKISFYNS